MSELLERVAEFSKKAHEGQFDKGGHPYYLHPQCVANMGTTEDEKIVALLHDVVEDTPITLEELKTQGFSDDVLAALKCLTKIKGEDYQTFIQRVATNPLAVKVKIQDLKDNMDLSRLGGKPHWKMETYKEALIYLEQNLKKSECK